MARLLIVVSLLMMSIGLVIAWPLVRAAVEFRPVRGQILDVIALPAADDRVQLAFAYEYPLPTNGEHALGYTLTDERLQPVADPVTDDAQANAVMNYLRKRPSVRVYYDVNHPIETAFMLNPIGVTGGVRAEHGALMVFIGLAFGILGQLARKRRDPRSR